MKIQCNVCEAAEANVLCCADEAALCWPCDQKVHAANKLAGKHQRVPLSTASTQMPKCDICQIENSTRTKTKKISEFPSLPIMLMNSTPSPFHSCAYNETVGYFFCLEDRALLCRKCDVAIHSANSLVSGHQRFLLTGVKVGLEATEAHAEPSLGKANNAEKISEPEPHSLPKKASPASSPAQYGKSMPVQASGCGDFPLSKLSFSGGSAGSISQWQFDEFLGYGDFTQSYNFMDKESSKADSGKLGSSDGSQILLTADGELEGDDCLGQVPETYWAVPQITSPPTSSGLYWPKSFQNPPESAAFVPDISSPPLHNLHHATNSKRRRHS
ncbi:B-box zinc finger protein 22-like isoform X1 [Salvia hispanica]|uniref:B-box zinc finger protein 22-like isoform X1 n=1 Tax=Salvia hispanica TaxID=49212 RepID=UPI002009318D|nr:B-box zinc finger protein 22-like isoform X1 [Salvia hispanica]